MYADRHRASELASKHASSICRECLLDIYLADGRPQLQQSVIVPEKKESVRGGS